MDWDSLGPLGVFLGTVGGGIMWITERIDRTKRERRQEMLNAANEKIKQRDETIIERNKEIEALKKELRLANVERHAWYWQLKEHDIEPAPVWREPDYV